MLETAEIDGLIGRSFFDQGCNEKQLQVIVGDTSRAIERYKHLFDGHEEALMGRSTLSTAGLLFRSVSRGPDQPAASGREGNEATAEGTEKAS